MPDIVYTGVYPVKRSLTNNIDDRKYIYHQYDGKKVYSFTSDYPFHYININGKYYLIYAEDALIYYNYAQANPVSSRYPKMGEVNGIQYKRTIYGDPITDTEKIKNMFLSNYPITDWNTIEN